MERQKHLLIVQDIDECLITSVGRHYEWLIAHGQQNGWKDLPDLQETLKLGGTHGTFSHYEGYWEKNFAMLSDPEFNSGLPLIDEGLQSLILLQSQLAFYLTTRPNAILELTKNELRRLGFPERPVVARPPHISIKETTPWKTDVLVRAAEELHALVVMIDDSKNLHEALLKLDHPQVETILFDGVMTPEHQHAVNWAEIVQLFERNDEFEFEPIDRSAVQAFTVNLMREYAEYDPDPEPTSEAA